MLRFTLTRQLGTPFYTLGVLEEPTTGFRCRTLERPVEETKKNPRRQFVAIPAGVYMLKVVAHDTDFTIGFSLNGSWRYAHLRGDVSFSGIPAGSICFGKSFSEETGLVGVKVKEPVLMKWTEEGASVLKNRILVPLAFVAGCYEKLMVADYEKAYNLFLVNQSCQGL